MTWIAWLALLLGLPLLLLLAAVLVPLRLEVEADESGVSGGIGWPVAGIRIDGRRREVELRVARWRPLRRPLARRTETKPAPEPRPRPAPRARSRSPLPPRAWLRIAPLALGEGRRALARVRVDRLRLDGVVATPDPALTGELYGYGCAVACALRARWPHAELHLAADFVATRPRGSAAVAVAVRPVGLAGSAWRLGRAFLRERRRPRRPRRGRDARREGRSARTHARSSTR